MMHDPQVKDDSDTRRHPLFYKVSFHTESNTLHRQYYVYCIRMADGFLLMSLVC